MPDALQENAIMYCQGCSGFASNGEPEYETDSFDETVDESTDVEITLNIPCGGCGGEFKTGSISITVDLVDAHNDACKVYDEDNGGIEVTMESDSDRFEELAKDRSFEVSDVNVDLTEDHRPKTKTLKTKNADGTPKVVPVPPRGQRKYYDFTVTASAKCSLCNAEFEATAEDSLGAGELEEAA